MCIRSLQFGLDITKILVFYAVVWYVLNGNGMGLAPPCFVTCHEDKYMLCRYSAFLKHTFDETFKVCRLKDLTPITHPLLVQLSHSL